MSKLFVKSTIIICHFHLTTNTEAHFVRSKGNVNGSYMSCPLLRKLKEFSFNEEAMYIYCLLISPKDSINTFATCRKLLCRKSRAAVYIFINCTTMCARPFYWGKYLLTLCIYLFQLLIGLDKCVYRVSEFYPFILPKYSLGRPVKRSSIT